MLDVVEDALVVVAREPSPRRLPVPEKLHAPVRRLHVVEPSVDPVVQGSTRCGEAIAGDTHVCMHSDVPERIAQHYHICIGEEEVVAEFKDAPLERELGPDEIEILFGHELCSRGEIIVGRPKEIAVGVHNIAMAEAGRVEGDNEDVVEEVFRVLTVLEALTVEIQREPFRAQASFTDVIITVRSSMATLASSRAKPGNISSLSCAGGASLG